MALSACVMVGDANKWVDDLAEKVKSLKVSSGLDKDANLGPLISPESKERVIKIIKNSKNEGARVVIDGTNY